MLRKKPEQHKGKFTEQKIVETESYLWVSMMMMEEGRFHNFKCEESVISNLGIKAKMNKKEQPLKIIQNLSPTENVWTIK